MRAGKQKMMVGLAFLVAFCLPNSLRAEGIGFTNELKIPIIVQGASLENNMVRRGPPILIAPRKIGWDINLKPGRRFITIYDGRQATRVLYRGQALDFLGPDLLFAVRVGPGNPPRVVIVPLPPR